MINTLILYNNTSTLLSLENKIALSFHDISISLSVKNNAFTDMVLKANPKIIFFEIDKNPIFYRKFFENCYDRNCETILISSHRKFALDASRFKISGYLLKPLDSTTLINTVEIAIQRIQKSCKSHLENKVTTKKSKEVIGVPTMEGYEFLPICNIIRCESHLKCTRVIIQGRSDVISSYNIGKFMKVLSDFDFYRPHQSHLINITKVKKYLKEGTLIMEDNSSVPVSRQNRSDLMNHVIHV